MILTTAVRMDPVLSICTTYCDKFTESEVNVCTKFWESIQSVCRSLIVVLKLIESEHNEHYFQKLLSTLARVESLRKLLKKEEIVNLELTSLDDVLEIGNELGFDLYKLGSSFNVEKTSTLIILTDHDRDEWANYQLERSTFTKKLDYCFAISSIPTLRDYIFNENLSDQEVCSVSRLIRNSKIPYNPIVKAFAQIQNDLVAARSELSRIRAITEKEFFEAQVKFTADLKAMFTKPLLMGETSP